MKTSKRTIRSKRRDARGSALLVSLMVIVGLSLLGLGFVAISETETAIARNQQASVQTQALAEAGVKLAIEWFQNPTWALANAAMPSNNPATNTNLAATKVNRVITAPDGTPTYTGYYKPDAKQMLFDKPYRPGNGDRFFGDEDTADIIINRKTDPTTIDNFNDVLLGTGAINHAQGEISEIRFYAPPIVGGTLMADGTNKNADGVTLRKFWSGGQRYGVATIKVTAVQYRDLSLTDTSSPIKKYDPKNIVSQHSVRIVVGEVPLPIPAGPIQGNANASFGGNFTVHWGLETARGDLNPSRNGTALPWANAYERPHFEHGYETVSAEVWPTVAASAYDDADYFHELLGKSFGDPWYGARCAGDNTIDGTTATNVNPQCYAYSQTSVENSAGNPSWSFQWQDSNVYPFKKRVVFPTILYDFWKRITSQNRGYRGLYYFKWDATNNNFQKNGSGAGKPMATWANTVNGAGLTAGVFFFDTVNARNPQKLSGAARAAELTPGEKWNNSDMNGGMLMEGFVYMNATSWGTSGAGNSPTTIDSNFPGEPFRDVGYPVWCTAANTPLGNGKCPAGGQWSDCGGSPCRSGAGDGVFSYQDLNGNQRFDVVVQASGAYSYHDPGVIAGPAVYVPKTWKSVAAAKAAYANQPCTAPAATYDGTNPAATDCSEPHEPYLNLVYPNTAGGSCVIQWEAAGSQTYRPKVRVNNQPRSSGAAPVTCPDTSNPDNCTSNSYDVDGAMEDLDVILYGVLYNEGQYDAEGNAAYYGSVLIQDDIIKGNGTADVWFDEKLIKGSWAPPNMPRVMVFAEQTDETQ